MIIPLSVLRSRVKSRGRGGGGVGLGFSDNIKTLQIKIYRVQNVTYAHKIQVIPRKFIK
jgi:hypothetical protein